jgi:2-polyprenyl-3-methyl-5-hydroxy-6-metoxy-1,4-benzoquinol methylase
MNLLTTTHDDVAAPSCPLCHHTQTDFLYQIKGDRILQCQSCSMIFAESQPFDKMQMYSQAYYSGSSESAGYQSYESELTSHQATFRQRLKSCERLLGRKGVLLDYGCAVGHLGKTAKDLGWRVFATDLSYYAVEAAHQQFGLDGFVSDLAEPPLKRQQFDMVTLYDVIEHMSEPRQILERLQPLIKDHGLLHVTTPNVESWSARMMRDFWYHFKPQEHLLYFSKVTLERILSECGFEILATSPAPSYMTLYDIAVRMRRYSKAFARAALSVIGFLGFDNWVTRIYTGEIQSWVRPRARLHQVGPVIRPHHPARSTQYYQALRELPVLEVICCPACAGDLEPDRQLTELTCLSCSERYEIRERIPILLRGLKQRKAAI